jgi:hypothetical protein
MHTDEQSAVFAAHLNIFVIFLSLTLILTQHENRGVLLSHF